VSRYPIWSPDGTMLGYSDQRQGAQCRECGTKLLHMWADCPKCDGFGGVMKMSIRKFIMDEVVRQGWKLGSSDFWFRVGAMMAAWNHAITFQGPLDTETVKLWGRMVEPETNREGWRTCGVRVGARACPDWQDVPRLMEEWEGDQEAMEPDKAYVTFETIHPFEDGNGRTGKIIHNWRLGTMREPVLVADYFGGGLP